MGGTARPRSFTKRYFAKRQASSDPDHPDTIASLFKLARLLASSTDPKVRNASRAVELAKKAVESSPKGGHLWNALGIAQYRFGDQKAAIASLEKSMELRQGGDSFDWFFLAMAHWQLGEKDKARIWFDQAVGWMDKKQPTNEELWGFRAEAAELLGMKDKKD